MDPYGPPILNLGRLFGIRSSRKKKEDEKTRVGKPKKKNVPGLKERGARWEDEDEEDSPAEAEFLLPWAAAWAADAAMASWYG